MFAFRHKDTGKFIGFSANSNDGMEFCCSISFSLESHTYAENVYANSVLETMKTIVSKSANGETVPWFNQSYDTPYVPKDIDMSKYEIVNLLTIKNKD